MTDQEATSIAVGVLVEARIIRRVGECVIGNLEDEIRGKCFGLSMPTPRKLEAREFDPDALRLSEFTVKDCEVARSIARRRFRL